MRKYTNMNINSKEYKIEPKADPEGANLFRADLRRADLRRADLGGANLFRADLRRADLEGANLRRAELERADLEGANLIGADLRRANLKGADLIGAELFGAKLTGAELFGADLDHKHYRFSTSGKHEANAYNGYIRIGCMYLSAEEWLERYKKIGTKEGYSSKEIEQYGNFIKMYCNEEIY